MATTSFKDIIKSTTVLGGSKVATIVIGIARTKVVALLLGSKGVGLISLFTSALAVIRNISQLGLNFSSVKDIAEAIGTGDEYRISKTILTLRRWIWFTGVAGMLVVVLLSKTLSELTFKDELHQWDFIALSITILLGSINGGQLAILRGFRKIKEIAKANIWAAVLGVIITVPLYYFYGLNGIVPVFIFTSLASVLVSYLYTKSLDIKTIELSLKDSFTHGKGMVKLGLYTVLTGAVTNLIAYYLRVYINDQSGLEALGFFAVASTLSVYYLDIVLSTLGTDYFPRLSEVNNDNAVMSKLVNEQTSITVLLGIPLVGLMMVLAQPIIILFYSSEFLGAVTLLEWMLLGVGFRLISWPKSYALLSKAKGSQYVIVEIIWNLIYIGLTILLLPTLGLKAVGVAFVVAYLFYYIIYLILTRKFIGFKYNTQTLKIVLPLYVLLASIFVLTTYSTDILYYSISIIVYLVVLTISIVSFNKIIPISEIVSKIRNKIKSK